MALGIIGLPIPDETILTFAGFLIYQKELNLIPTYLFSIMGSITGMSVSYYIGNKLGKKFLYDEHSIIHISKVKLDKTDNWIQRHGSWFLFIGYFIPGVRHLTALITGTSKTSYRKFLSFVLPGGFLWISVFISLGFYAGRKWKKISCIIQDHIRTYFFYTAIILMVALIVIGLIKYLKKENLRND